MPYLVLVDKNGEFDRRDLREPLVIGRALDCQVCVRDILLSRHHCKVEMFNGRWIVSDLGSKNGTRVGPETISKHVLSDGDVVSVGKVQVCFREGDFVPAPTNTTRRRDVRPADPKEDLAGTVSGFQYFDMEEDSRISGFPIPKPKPAEPASYRQEDVHSMVMQISSSQWDLALSEPDLRHKPAADVPKEVVQRQKSIEESRSETAAKTNPDDRPPVVRSTTPDRRAHIPRWLAWAYVMLATAVAAAALGVILAKSVG